MRRRREGVIDHAIRHHKVVSQHGEAGCAVRGAAGRDKGFEHRLCAYLYLGMLNAEAMCQRARGKKKGAREKEKVGGIGVASILHFKNVEGLEGGGAT